MVRRAVCLGTRSVPSSPPPWRKPDKHRADPGDNRAMWERIREYFAAARAADALELEQMLVRLTINAGVDLCLLASLLWDGIDERERILVAMIACAALVILAQLVWILLRPGVNPVRRCAGV